MKRIILSILAAIVLATGMGATSVRAGAPPHNRESYYIGLGVGGGIADIDIVDGDDGDEGGCVGFLRFGKALRDDLVVGIETSGWGREMTVDGDDTDWFLGHFSAALTWFPGNGGLYLRGGAGYAYSEIKAVQNTRTVSEEEGGIALLGALGYEWRITQNIALGPQVDYVYLHIDGDLVDSAGYASGSVQLNYYW